MPDTLIDFLYNNEIHTEANFREYQAAAAEAFSSAADDAGGGDTFTFEESSRDVNAASAKGTKAKSKAKPDAMTENGSIQKIMRSPKGTVLDIKNSKGDVVPTLTINKTNIVHHTTDNDDNTDVSDRGSKHTHNAVPPL